MQPSDLPPVCPVNCPNRRGDGLNLFGWHFDPIELTLHLAILVCLGIPAARASVRDDFDLEQGIKWLSSIVGSSTLIRLSPTDRINAYLKLSGDRH
jgi:hypothetical protein